MSNQPKNHDASMLFFCEQLEERQLLSSVVLNAVLDQIQIAGESSDNNAIVSLSSDGTEYIVQLDGVESSFAASDVSSIRFRGWNGDDRFVNLTDLPSLAEGGLGSDSLTGGTSSDELFGGSGDDLLRGRDGDDLLLGEEGSDEILGGNGVDQIDGGAGDDVLSGGRQVDTIIGGTGNDTIDGGQANDQIDGGFGDDVIRGSGGADFIEAGIGNDLIFGGFGDDIVFAGSGDDIVYGGRGNDLLFGERNEDRIFGGAGDDIIDGGFAADRLIGGTGADRYVRTNGADFVDLQPEDLLIDSLATELFARVGEVRATDFVIGGSTIQLGINNDGSFVGNGVGLVFEGRDFLLPGTPLAGYSVGFNGETFTNRDPTNDSGLIGFDVEVQDLSNGLFFGMRAEGAIKEQLNFERVAVFNEGENFITVATRVTNVGLETLDNVAILENHDPDQGIPGTFNTENDVLLEGDLGVSTHVSAAFPDGLTYGFGSIDPAATVSIENFRVSDPFAVINSPIDPNGALADNSINIAFDFGSLAPGESATGVFAIILGDSQNEVIDTYQAIAPRLL